jgi:dienelactone hydrolase
MLANWPLGAELRAAPIENDAEEMTYIASEEVLPSSDSRGWMQWPANEDYSLQFLSLLGAAQDGGSTVSECLHVASGIDPACEESWYAQWKKAADLSKSRGDIAHARGHVCTALSNWLRAANYYRTAQAFMGIDDPRQSAVVAQMMTCSQSYLLGASPKGEIVEIPWGEGTIQGYFLPPAGKAGRKVPVVVCVGGPEQYKEEYLCRLPRYAHERGMALLLIDLPGQGHRRGRDEGFGRYDVETVISGWVDFLEERRDVNSRKIVILGDGLGASFATRGARFDPRFAAAVCDAGIWDLHERAFLAARIYGTEPNARDISDHIVRLCGKSSAIRHQCPMLVALGERDWLDADHVARCCAAMVSHGQDVDLKVFSAVEAAPLDAQHHHPAIANEFIFDWIADRLAGIR